MCKNNTLIVTNTSTDTDILQFDLKFTKGNSKVEPGKLMYLQKRYAQLYVEERGEEHKGMVEAVVDVALRHLHAHPQYAGSLQAPIQC